MKKEDKDHIQKTDEMYMALIGDSNNPGILNDIREVISAYKNAKFIGKLGMIIITICGLIGISFTNVGHAIVKLFINNQ